MVLQLSTRTPVEYETNLVQFIRNESQRRDDRILFLNCQSSFTRALLSRPDLKPVMNHLSIVQTESAEDLSFLLKSVHLQEMLSHVRVCVVSPYYHLISELSAWKQKTILHSLEEQFEKLEQKFGVHVVVAEG